MKNPDKTKSKNSLSQLVAFPRNEIKWQYRGYNVRKSLHRRRNNKGRPRIVEGVVVLLLWVRIQQLSLFYSLDSFLWVSPWRSNSSVRETRLKWNEARKCSLPLTRRDYNYNKGGNIYLFNTFWCVRWVLYTCCCWTVGLLLGSAIITREEANKPKLVATTVSTIKCWCDQSRAHFPHSSPAAFET